MPRPGFPRLIKAPSNVVPSGTKIPKPSPPIISIPYKTSATTPKASSSYPKKISPDKSGIVTNPNGLGTSPKTTIFFLEEP
jgi:hypothetical protein